jgi:drug/metabolite transporter (DMT)-like permease
MLIRAMPLVFVLLWSTGFIVARYGMPLAPPMTFLALRYSFSILCLLLWIMLAGILWPSTRIQWLHLSVTGLLMHGGYLGGVWAAVKAGMGSGLIALIVTRRQWAGLVLGFAGLVLVVSRKLGAGGEADAFNLSLAIFALFCITTGTLYQKRFVTPCDVRSANTVQLLAALLVTLPMALLEAESIRWNAEFAGAMAWSVLVLTLGASSLLYMLIHRGAATAVTSLLYLVPPTTAVMAWVLFSEPITPVTLAGTALTALGVSLVVKAAR